MKVDLGAFRFLVLDKFWIGLWNEINDDDCWGMAAQLSYYFLMAFFPFLIFLSALIGFIPVGPDAVYWSSLAPLYELSMNWTDPFLWLLRMVQAAAIVVGLNAAG